MESFIGTEQGKPYIKMLFKNIGRMSGWYFPAQQKNFGYRLQILSDGIVSFYTGGSWKSVQ